MSSRPLDGVRVIELGQLVAGGFAGALLAWFGADVIKIEPPGGDPLRSWRGLDQGTSLWWRTVARNKRSAVVDLRRDRGRDVIRRLVAGADVLIENFRPGTLERWGLGPDDLRRAHPSLVVVRVSGFGQDGPYSDRPGFAAVCEAIGGLRHLTGHPGEIPVRPNLSLGDSLAGLHAAFGAVLALYSRDGRNRRGDRGESGDPRGSGQVVDVAIFEAVFNLLEAVIPEYDRLGMNRGPSGASITGIVPTGCYRTADGAHVVIGANGESIFARLCRAMGRPDMAEDPRLASNPGRVANAAEVEDAIAGWVAGRPRDEVIAALADAGVPAGPIYDAAAMMADPHFEARGLFERVPSGGRPLALPAMAPRLTLTPGRTDSAGPELGEHTDAVLAELGYSPAEIDELRADGAIA
jgi:crotonobetainyl-CoA:carnitine CoA-transferase CaiB-like acyl-CoA transferase